MSQAIESAAERISRRIYRTVLASVLAVVVLLLLVSGAFTVWPLQVLFYLTVGWGFFLVRVAPQMTFNVSSVPAGLLAVILFGVCLHFALRWFTRAIGPSVSEGSQPWRRRWTAGIVTLIVLVFAPGIAALGVIHQVGWLATAPDPLTQGGI